MKRFCPIILAILLGGCGHQTHSSIQGSQSRDILGVGWQELPKEVKSRHQLFESSLKSLCVTGGFEREPGSLVVDGVYYSSLEAEKNSESEEVKVDAGFLFFKTNFENKNQNTTETLSNTIIMKLFVKRETDRQELLNPTWKSGIPKKRAEFQKHCGDSYISAVANQVQFEMDIQINYDLKKSTDIHSNGNGFHVPTSLFGLFSGNGIGRESSKGHKIIDLFSKINVSLNIASYGATFDELGLGDQVLNLGGACHLYGGSDLAQFSKDVEQCVAAIDLARHTAELNIQGLDDDFNGAKVVRIEPYKNHQLKQILKSPLPKDGIPIRPDFLDMNVSRDGCPLYTIDGNGWTSGSHLMDRFHEVHSQLAHRSCLVALTGEIAGDLLHLRNYEVTISYKLNEGEELIYGDVLPLRSVSGHPDAQLPYKFQEGKNNESKVNITIGPDLNPIETQDHAIIYLMLNREVEHMTVEEFHIKPVGG